jgi:glycosidase
MHLFEYDPPSGTTPRTVCVGGDFNKWSQNANPMTSDGAGHFVAEVRLPEGPHSYRFLVDGQWVNDGAARSDATLQESIGVRGENSAIFVGPDLRALPTPEPGKLNPDGLHHVQSSILYFDPISGNEARIAVGVQDGSISSAAVISQVGSEWRRDALYPAETRKGMSFFANVVLTQSIALRYFFELRSGNTTAYFAGGKLYSTQANARDNAWQGAMKPSFETPAWAQNAVWYQIFPERFRNGDPANDPPNVAKWTMRWVVPPSTAPSATTAQARGARGGRGGGVGGGNRRYGGDIQGIQSQLPYLRSLGVTCIYLNPVFKSPSVHKYDTSDYRHIDENFGVLDNDEAALIANETERPETWKWTKSDRVFLDFVAEAHRQGFKVVIDGVFNHAGGQFGPYQDLRQNGQNSRYADWFQVVNWNPVSVMSFGDRPGGNMPELKKDPVTGLAPGPREFFFNITRRWLAPDGDPSRGVDGFRLDYAQHVPRVFWVDYRKVVKSVKPDAFISGEIWTPAHSYLYGDAWDATMQYPFLNALNAFFVAGNSPITASVFAQRLQQLTMLYPFQVSLNQMNLIGSHDTERWASRFVNANPATPATTAPRARGSYNSSKPNDLQWQRLKQSVVVQMTYVGAPMVYYGDEVGMWGGNDPDDRQPMIWRELQPYDDPQVTFKQDLFDHYQRLIAVRSRLSALRTGFAHTVLTDDPRGIAVFARSLGDDQVYVLVNHSESAQSVEIAIGPASGDGAMIDWLDPSQAFVRPAPASALDGRPQIAPVSTAPGVVSHNGKASVTLKPWGAMILAPASSR